MLYICKWGASGAATLLRLSLDGGPVSLHFTAQDVPWLLIYSRQHHTNFIFWVRFLCGDTWSAHPPMFGRSSCLFHSACHWRPRYIRICTSLCSENTFRHSDRGWRHKDQASLPENRELSQQVAFACCSHIQREGFSWFTARKTERLLNCSQKKAV